MLESPVPRDELIEFILENDEVRIDENYAIVWSDSLDFRVEKSRKSLIGFAVSGEGLVNVGEAIVPLSVVDKAFN